MSRSAKGAESGKKRGRGRRRVLKIALLVILVLIVLLLFGASGGGGLFPGGSGVSVSLTQETQEDAAAEASGEAAKEDGTESAEGETGSTETAETTVLYIRVSGTDICLDDAPTDEAALRTELEGLTDSMSVVLQDDYAEEGTYSAVRALLDEYAADYVEQQLD